MSFCIYLQNTNNSFIIYLRRTDKNELDRATGVTFANQPEDLTESVVEKMVVCLKSKELKINIIFILSNIKAKKVILLYLEDFKRSIK